MLRSVFIANRGEIAGRVARTCDALGIASTTSAGDYLDPAAQVAQALAAGADSVHPGYGFLSENAGFARAVAEAGLVFIGPSPEVMEQMGRKDAAREIGLAAGVPVVPRGEDAGFPVLVKAAAGGGGKGMRVVRSADELEEATAAAKREAASAFGDDTMLIEKYVERGRHIEVQVIADHHGTVRHLFERDCSTQRRHQKVLEEAPAPTITDAQRSRVLDAAVALASHVGYTNTGTVEFLLDDETGDVYFLEMNTRLQVEHPVTEAVTGLDLVELQLRIAAGEPLPLGQDDVRLSGHAIEARVYAEDPAHDFLPTGGRILLLRQPTTVRGDSGIAEGFTVGSDYDPMLAKFIAPGSDRAHAISRLDAALAATTILGVTTNVGFLRSLLADPDVAAGRLDTELVDRLVAGGVDASPPPHLVAAVAVASLGTGGDDPWSRVDGWRLGGQASIAMRIDAGDGPVGVTLRAAGDGWDATVGAADQFHLGTDPAVSGAMRHAATLPAHRSSLDRGSTVGGLITAADGDITWVGRGGSAWGLRVEHTWKMDRPGVTTSADGLLTSPMPGAVLDVRVEVGDTVRAGQTLAVVEAMKMEHPLTSRIDGVVAEVLAHQGQQVGRGEPIVRVEHE